jgi:two-component system, OmpR family, response regulator VicR
MRILICEDNTLALRTLTLVLEREGFVAETADDGNKALDYLQKYTYDLIVVDIHLPFHSGLEVIRHLRTELKKDTPVIVLSAFSDLQMQKQAGEMGINSYIVKPFNPTDLVSTIKSILKL